MLITSGSTNFLSIQINSDDMEKFLQCIREFEKLSLNKDTPSVVWLNSKEAAKYLDVSPRTLTTYRQQKIIPYSVCGRKYKYKKSDLDEWINNNRIN